MYAGSSSAPFTGNLDIVLTGGMDADNVLIDDFSNPGNKVIVVTGRLELYGVSPSTKWTRLTASGKVGDTVINVASAANWKVKL